MRRLALPALVLVALALAAAGCGGSKSSSSSDKATQPAAALRERRSSRPQAVPSCHTMEAAGATGHGRPEPRRTAPERADRRAAGHERRERHAGLQRASCRRPRSTQVAAFVSTAAGTGRGRKDPLSRTTRKVGDCRDTSCIRAGVREPRLQRRAEEGARGATTTSPPQTALWRPTVTRSRTRSEPASSGLQGRRRQGARRRQRHMPVRVLPRPAGNGSSPEPAPTRLRPLRARSARDPKIEANAFIYYQCNHGLGHGLMLYTGLRPAPGARLLPQARRPENGLE